MFSESVLLAALVFFSNGGVAVRELGGGAGADELGELADPAQAQLGQHGLQLGWGNGCHGSWWLLCAYSGTHCCWEKWLAGEASPACLGTGTVSWNSDVPVVVALVVALSNQGRTFVLSPSHCQLRQRKQRPEPACSPSALFSYGNTEVTGEHAEEVLRAGLRLS